MIRLLNRHYHSLQSAIVKIFSSPIEHLLNILSLGLIIAIVGAIYTITQNANTWQQDNIAFPQIVVYLADNANTDNIKALEAKIDGLDRLNVSHLIRNYQLISKDDALRNLSNASQDDNAKALASQVATFKQNPLPNVLIINTNSSDSQTIKQMAHKISAASDLVDSVDIDTDYANKVSNLVAFISKIAIFSEVIFSIMIILIIYNLTRLQMMLQQDEIIVSRLIGASDSFIMRPLAYYASSQMLIAAIVAYYLLHLFSGFLNGIFMHFSSLFGNAFALKELSFVQLGQMLVILLAFTLLAVFVAVRWVFRYNKRV